MQVECSHSRDVGVPQTNSQNRLNKIAGPFPFNLVQKAYFKGPTCY